MLVSVVFSSLSLILGPHNRSFHLTKPLVTHLAGARSAPNDFAGEANVR